MEKVIVVKKLVKKYSSITAVDGISFDVKKGEIFGLLGENGAGKTTTLEIIEGLRLATDGSVEVLGYNIPAEMRTMKQKIGVQLQSSAYYNYLKLTEILDLFAKFYGKKVNAEKLLDSVELGFKKNAYVSQLSGGQKQRFSIVASLVNDPEIVFLDEPTTGLDPVARRNLWGLIKEIRQRGKTVVLTTHYLEEAEILCDRIAIMEKGSIVAYDKTNSLVERASSPYTISFETATSQDKVEKQLADFGEVDQPGKKNHYVLKMKTQDKLGQAIDAVRKFSPIGLAVRPASLEDVFIELTGKSIADDEKGES